MTNVTIVGETEVTNLVATGTAEFNNITATGIATIEDITITSLTTEGEASINKLVTPLFSIATPAEVVADDFIDGIIRDVDVLAPMHVTKDLVKINTPSEKIVEIGEEEEIPEQILNTYELKYVGENYKLALMKDGMIELLNYDNENKQFSQPSDTNVQVNYILKEH